MPSGPKKRKAARRKKEKENNNININLSSTNNPLQGNDDLKYQNEVEERGLSAVRPNASDVKSVEEVCGDFKIEKVLEGKEDSFVTIKRDLKSEDSYEKENGKPEHIETAIESCYESENCGGISNGESLAEKNSKDELYNFLEEETVCHEMVKSDDSSASDMTAVKINSLVQLEETGGNSAAKDSVNSVKTVASLSEAEKCDTGLAPLPEVTDLAGKMNEDSVYPLTNENATSSLEEPKSKESNSEVLTSSFNGAVHTKDSEAPKSTKNQPSVSSAPNLVRKTSWWSCCGIFEVLSGSDR
ncbi:uncharacterized protein LOC123910194 isoform X1 [Trifolium pratense]|uniref:uncharacterized protein LOC123910194 isoform X1 n=1 Tax=Trifolium pratense TaxID=57577 RepID=UPI001E696B05|nr:uncharacterized protein LOC123910194 isoform X1 [Trifolium pratense]